LRTLRVLRVGRAVEGDQAGDHVLLGLRGVHAGAGGRRGRWRGREGGETNTAARAGPGGVIARDRRRGRWPPARMRKR
jgi:hypothetical protein